MVSLIDIGPAEADVDFRNQKVKVQGVSTSALFSLLQSYPELRMILSGREVTSDIVQTLIGAFPQTIARVIAAGVGHEDDPAYIEYATKMTAGEQAEFLGPILKLTFPKGVKSFLDGLTEIADSAAGPGWDRVMKSPEQSSSASSTGTRPTSPGDTPPDNSPAGQS